MTYPATQTFWMEPTGDVAVALRRYHSDPDSYTSGGGYHLHQAFVFLGVEAAIYREDRGDGRRLLDSRPTVDHADPRWPTSCGFQLADEDVWQVWQEQLYRRADTGDVVSLKTRRHGDPAEAPVAAAPGAVWDAWWMPEFWRGPDGIALMVRLPDGHDWHVDGEASNCTRKGDRSHKCWIRHGDPRAANLTVDKNGNTCAAGAGSIMSGDYHGFLTDGILTAG